MKRRKSRIPISSAARYLVFRDAHDDAAGNEECTDEIQKKIPGGQAIGHGQETFHKFLYPKLYDTKSDDGEREQIFAGFEEFLHQRSFVLQRNKLIDQVILNRKENQTGCIFCAEPFHQPVLDGFDGARAHFQFLGDFLSGKFHADIFHHFPLAFTEGDFCVQLGITLVRACDFFRRMRFTKLLR